MGRRRKWQENGKKYIVRSLMISTCHRTWSNKLEEVEMGGACGTHREEDIYIYIYIYRVLVGETEEKSPVRRSLIILKGL